MVDLAFLFRADETNAGDWWCPPFRYFRFKPAIAGDVLDTSLNTEGLSTIIVGGGGIGTEFFRPHLNRLSRRRNYKIIAWGVGVDTKSDTKKILKNNNHDLYGDYFNNFDDVGIRVHSDDQKFRHIPCASCMSNLFDKYRQKKPTKHIGIYSHKRAQLSINDNTKYDYNSNEGNNIEEKLSFLSNHEYIITNTYHGAYWGTLLERKIIIIPFKSGLFSFKHKPTYSFDGKIDNDLLHSAKIHHGTLEESRKLNIEFYEYIVNKYNLI